MKQSKNKIIYCIVTIILVILVYMVCCKAYYGKVYLLHGNGIRHEWKMDDLQKAAKDFQVNENGEFVSISPDPWFLIEESFSAKTVVIDADDIGEKRNSQIFYYSDNQELDESYSYYFQLHKGLNYLQIPEGQFNKFRLDLTDISDASLKINSITIYGSRVVPTLLLAIVIGISLIILKIGYIIIFKKNSFHKKNNVLKNKDIVTDGENYVEKKKSKLIKEKIIPYLSIATLIMIVYIHLRAIISIPGKNKHMSFQLFQNTIILFMVIIITLGTAFTIYFFVNKWRKEKKEVIKDFLFVFLIMLLGYGCLIWSKHYSVDSFNILYDMSPYWQMQIGRYMNCGSILLAQIIGTNQVIYQQLFMVLWLITLSAFVLMIGDRIKNNIPNLDDLRYKNILLFVAMSFLNVFTMELMLFTETAMVFILGNLTLGLSIWVALSDKKYVIRWSWCTIFLIASIGTYQSYIGIFETFVLIGIFLKWNDNRRKRYKESFTALAIGGIVSAFNVILTKNLIAIGLIDDSGRGAAISFKIIKGNIIKLIEYQVAFWKDADGILPAAIMPMMALALLLILCYTMKKQKTLEQRIYLICVILSCYTLGYAPHIIEKNLVLSPRSNIAIWSVIACIFILGFFNLPKNNIFNRLINTAFFVALLCNIFTMQDMASNEQAMNAVDIKEAQEIGEYIKKYESNTGNVVLKISTCRDNNCTYYQPISNYHNCELGARIMATDYSNYRLIGYVLGRNMEKVDMPDNVYLSYFKDKDWNELNLEEQAVFVDDTLYFAIY